MERCPEEFLRSAMDYEAGHHGATCAHHLLTLALKRVRDSRVTAELAQQGVGVWMQKISKENI